MNYMIIIDMKPLKGVKVITTATHLPGPMAAQSLRQWGATVLKVEPLSGDFLFHYYPDWYKELHKGIKILRLDLKSENDQRKLYQQLKSAQFLLTAQKPKSLSGLGLDWKILKKKFPKLHHIGVVSGAGHLDDLPGHDLNFQAQVGLVAPPTLPRVLAGDYFAAQKMVETALALRLEKKKFGQRVWVSIEEAAHSLAKPVFYGATLPAGMLGGAFAVYNIYGCRDGHIALCALEESFQKKLKQELKIDSLTYPNLQAVFAAKSCEEWSRWAREHSMPLSVVK